MTQFDSLLRRALMDANLAQYARVLRQIETETPDFSPQYRRERARLLADPWGWAKRRSGGRRRLNWRLVAIAAALLLLSACAYAVATGQFSQWFPRRGVDPSAPETSEGVLSGIGTAIGQSVSVGDETVTLNAALWDGTSVWLSLSVEGPHIPEAVRQNTPLDTSGCRLSLRQDQWEAYTRNSLEQFYAETEPELSPEQVESAVQARLGQEARTEPMHLDVLDHGENTLTLEVTSPLVTGLFPETEQPELTLHLENIATCVDEDGTPRETAPDEVILKGPFTFTFTLERPALALSIRYDAANAELPPLDIPYRFTGFQLSTTGLTAFYAAQDPKELPGPGEILILTDSLWGLWTEDGTHVDLTGMGGGGGGDHVGLDYPYPIDPAAVTAVDVAGTRVELSELERVDG